MVAYNFQPRFAPLIREGLKRQTIRKGGRLPNPGNRLQLFTGQRTAACARILEEDPVCTAVLSCTLHFASGMVSAVFAGGHLVTDLHGFAIADGFADIADMSAFWREHHGARRFDGWVIEWAMPRAERRVAA